MAVSDFSSHSDRVAAYYDENTTPFYLERWHPEDVHFGLFDQREALDQASAVKRMTWSIVSPANLRAGERVLDAGCGVGGAALDLARETGAHVLGVTISPVQVTIANERARTLGLCHLARFERADCSVHLPCDDASVDCIVTIEAACHFEDKAAFLRECRRVLKPGGRLAGSDWMATDGTPAEDYRNFLEPVCESWRLAGMISPSRWSAMLVEAGFEVRECEDFGEAVLPNARILGRARLDLMLEVANRSQPAERAALWQRQYDTLMQAWLERRFTIGRIFALAT